jgi:hypothetical protein
MVKTVFVTVTVFSRTLDKKPVPTQHFTKHIPPFALLITLLVAAACQPASTETPVLPTLAVLPSLTPSEAPTATSTETETPGPSSTPTITPTPSQTLTYTPFPTFTPTQRQSPTLRATIEPTQAAIATGTAAVQEAVRFSTVTPGGEAQANATPQMVADLTITEAQFQEEVNVQIDSYPAIEQARVDFVPGGINVELTALGGQAFITGNVFVAIEVTGSFATISIGDITVNAPEPPEAYIETVTGDFFTLMVSVLDTILTQRLGEESNLENIVLTDVAMEITLLVPEQ